MSNLDIFLACLCGSLLGSTVGFYFAWIVQKDEYKWAYNGWSHAGKKADEFSRDAFAWKSEAECQKAIAEQRLARLQRYGLHTEPEIEGKV